MSDFNFVLYSPIKEFFRKKITKLEVDSFSQGQVGILHGFESCQILLKPSIIKIFMYEEIEHEFFIGYGVLKSCDGDISISAFPIARELNDISSFFSLFGSYASKCSNFWGG
jgi:F0F1-type ATP synthase epsilon subunit